MAKMLRANLDVPVAGTVNLIAYRLRGRGAEVEPRRMAAAVARICLALEEFYLARVFYCSCESGVLTLGVIPSGELADAATCRRRGMNYVAALKALGGDNAGRGRKGKDGETCRARLRTEFTPEKMRSLEHFMHSFGLVLHDLLCGRLALDLGGDGAAAPGTGDVLEFPGCGLRWSRYDEHGLFLFGGGAPAGGMVHVRPGGPGVQEEPVAAVAPGASSAEALREAAKAERRLQKASMSRLRGRYLHGGADAGASGVAAGGEGCGTFGSAGGSLISRPVVLALHAASLTAFMRGSHTLLGDALRSHGLAVDGWTKWWRIRLTRAGVIGHAEFLMEYHDRLSDETEDKKRRYDEALLEDSLTESEARRLYPFSGAPPFAGSRARLLESASPDGATAFDPDICEKIRIHRELRGRAGECGLRCPRRRGEDWERRNSDPELQAIRDGMRAELVHGRYRYSYWSGLDEMGIVFKWTTEYLYTVSYRKVTGFAAKFATEIRRARLKRRRKGGGAARIGMGHVGNPKAVMKGNSDENTPVQTMGADIT